MRQLLIALIILAMAGHVKAEEIKVTVTAYCEKDNHTAAGTHVNTETVAVSHDLKRKLKWKDRIYIEGVGWRKVLDLMHPRWTKRLDIWMPTRAECMKWGVRKRMAVLGTEAQRQHKAQSGQ
jgi:3D (Asp-Asp-Asp) domain-containing protein